MKKLTLYFPPQFADPSLAGKSRNLEPDSPEVTLGRGPKNTIPIHIQTVSRNHAVLHYLERSGGWFLTDTQSRGGTALNGYPLLPGNPEPVGAGDKFWLATPEALICVLRSDDDTIREETPAPPPAGPPTEISVITPPPAASNPHPDTWVEVAAIAVSWVFSASTPLGQVARLAALLLFSLGALGAFLAFWEK